MLAIEKVNESIVIDNKTVHDAVSDIIFAVQTANTAYGIIQYNAYQINQAFKDMPKGGKIADFYKYEDFCKSVFGIERSQAFNLAKAGRLIRKVRTFDNKYVYLDCFTIEAAGLTNDVLKGYEVDTNGLIPYSFTVLLEIAKKWGNLTVAEITQKLHDNNIGANLTVNEVKEILNPAKLTTKKKSSQLDNGTDNGTNNGTDNSTNNGTNNGTENSNEKSITITLTEAQALALKVQLIQFTEKPIKGKNVDKIIEFINKMNEQLK